MDNELEMLNTKIEESPNNAELYYKRAQFYFDKRNYENTIEDCNKAIKLNDKYADAHALLGYAYYRIGNFDKALSSCEKATSIDGKCYIAYTVRGNVFTSQDKYDEALVEFNTSIKINQKYAPAYNARGSMYYYLNKYEDALSDCTKAIEINEKLTNAYLNRGKVYSGLKKFEEALENFNKAIELEEKYDYLYRLRANLYSDFGKYEEALKDINKAIELNEKSVEAYNSRGNIYYNFKKYNDALNDYTKAIGLGGEKAYIYSNRGNTFKKLNNYEAALNDYNKAIELDEKFAIAYYNRGSIYYTRNDYVKTLNDYKAAYKLYVEKENIAYIQLLSKEIEVIEGLLRKVPEKNSKIKELMELIDKSGIKESIREIEDSFNDFIEEKQLSTDLSIPEFVVLRRWNSYTPIIANNYFISKGGGYFFKTFDCGVVIDPGFNFIDNYKSLNYKFSEIDHVLITHAHNDHTSDLESILTLLHEYNENIEGSFDNPKEGTIIHEVISEQETKVEESDRERIEKLTNERFKLSSRRKRIRLYMTVSTYKKYSNLLDLDQKSDYDVVIIKAGENVPIQNPNNKPIKDYAKGIKIKAIYAKHNDMMSDKDSVGFVIQYNNFILIYTGDTGFDKSIEEQYYKLNKEFRDKKIILLGHLGGFKEYEKSYNVGEFNGGKAFYKNHLGRLGLGKLIEIIKPHICIISEFGEEFRETRCKLTGIFQKVYPNTIFFAADIGFCINSENFIRVIDKAKYPDELLFNFVSPAQVKICELISDSSLHYYKEGVDSHMLTEILVKKYNQSLR